MIVREGKVLKIMSEARFNQNIGKLCLNEKTGTLHIVGKCCHAKVLYDKTPIFENIDEALASETRYAKHCKLCFKDK